jgi:flagella basal body P-ring formation protein FlgA
VIEKLGLYRVTMIRWSQIPKGTVGDPRSLVGKVAVTNIPAGAELTNADFGPLQPHPSAPPRQQG